MIINILGIDWNIDMIIFLLQSCEGGDDLAFFIWQQEGFCWSKFDLVLVLVWDFPLVLEGNSGLVLHLELLLRRNTLEDWWEEELLIVGQFESWLVAVTHKIDLLDVGWVMIVDALSLEVELTGLSWVELEADDSEALSVDQAH